VANVRNSLPAVVKDFASIRRFRGLCDRINLNQFVEFLCL